MTSIECELALRDSDSNTDRLGIDGPGSRGLSPTQDGHARSNQGMFSATVADGKVVLKEAFQEVFGPLGMVGAQGKAKMSKRAVIRQFHHNGGGLRGAP